MRRSLMVHTPAENCGEEVTTVQSVEPSLHLCGIHSVCTKDLENIK